MSTMQRGRGRGTQPLTSIGILSVKLMVRLAMLEATFKLFIGNLPPDFTVETLQVGGVGLRVTFDV